MPCSRRGAQRRERGRSRATCAASASSAESTPDAATSANRVTAACPGRGRGAPDRAPREGVVRGRPPTCPSAASKRSAQLEQSGSGAADHEHEPRRRRGRRTARRAARRRAARATRAEASQRAAAASVTATRTGAVGSPPHRSRDDAAGERRVVAAQRLHESRAQQGPRARPAPAAARARAPPSPRPR